MTKKPLTDAVVSYSTDGVIMVGLSSGGMYVTADMDHDRAAELRAMLAEAMGHVGPGAHDERAAVAEQFKAALLDGLDDLRRRGVHRRISPGAVADLIARVALEVGRG